MYVGFNCCALLWITEQNSAIPQEEMESSTVGLYAEAEGQPGLS